MGRVISPEDRLDDQGDGIRSFVGVMVALLSLKRSVFLIDEPEAFLHPPHAFRMGELLAEHASDGRQIVAATHSVDLLRGVISKTQDVTVIRIGRDGLTNEFKSLRPDDLKSIASDPLLSSARVLDGLFYNGAIVVEADRDARFYNIVSDKRAPGAGFHFVNADSKQTVSRIIKLYKQIGVRTAGIVDFDVLNDKSEFQIQVDALGLGEESRKLALELQEAIAAAVQGTPPDERLEIVKQQLVELHSSIEAAPHDVTAEKEKVLRQIERKCQEIAGSTKAWRQFKQEGCAALNGEVRAKFDRLYSLCASGGLFINPAGELESMLCEYAVPYTTDKRAWFQQALGLIRDIQVDDRKQPWRLMKDVHGFLKV